MKFPSVPTLLRVFNTVGVLDFVKCFFCIDTIVIVFGMIDRIH